MPSGAAPRHRGGWSTKIPRAVAPPNFRGRRSRIFAKSPKRRDGLCPTCPRCPGSFSQTCLILQTHNCKKLGHFRKHAAVECTAGHAHPAAAGAQRLRWRALTPPAPRLPWRARIPSDPPHTNNNVPRSCVRFIAPPRPQLGCFADDRTRRAESSTLHIHHIWRQTTSTIPYRTCCRAIFQSIEGG